MNKLFEQINCYFVSFLGGVIFLSIFCFPQPLLGATLGEILSVSDYSLSRLFDFSYGLSDLYDLLDSRDDDSIRNIMLYTDGMNMLINEYNRKRLLENESNTSNKRVKHNEDS